MAGELSGPTTLYVKLPDSVTCSQCIIQVGSQEEIFFAKSMIEIMKFLEIVKNDTL